jgi:hypothetical protein
VGTKAITNFDRKYEQGQIAEKQLDDMFGGKVAIEIKSDQKWIDTGNLFVEVSCYKASKGGWVPSGIYEPNLEVDLFWYEFSGIHLVAPPSAWVYAVETQGVIVSGGDESNPSKGALLNFMHLAVAFREWAKDNRDN